jgi:transcription-repair coupling factor (superfamily II helicase)
LAQAVRELREKKETKVSEEKKEALIPSFPSIDLPLEAYLPEDYVPDEALRLRLYRRMGEITTVVQAEEMGKELEDRFGELPRAARDLMFLLRLKALAIAAGVESIAGQGDRIVVRWRPDGPVDRRRLEEAFGSGVQVGRGQFSLPLERGWREELVQGLKMAIDYQAKAVG